MLFMKEGITPYTVVQFFVLFCILFCFVFFSDNTLASISFLIDQTFGIMLNLCYAIVLV